MTIVARTNPDSAGYGERQSAAVEVVEPLSATESEALGYYERAINEAFRSFREMGVALQRIRDLRLYRETHATFEDYCQGRWRIGRNYANKVITAAGIADAVGTAVPVPNEAVARELARFPENLRQTVWDELTAGGDVPTAAAIRDGYTITKVPWRELFGVVDVTEPEPPTTAAAEKCRQFVRMLRTALDVRDQAPFESLTTEHARDIHDALSAAIADIQESIRRIPRGEA